MKSPAKQRQRRLLATMTQEPFQPVRLYYQVPAPASVIGKLRGLVCMVEAPTERSWHWLFRAEAVPLRLAAGYDDVPEEKRPIILGRIRFPGSGGMTLQTDSIERAIQGARFFASRLGPEVVAVRCRVVNRCFASDEGTPDKLMRTLDQNVTVCNPRQALARLEEDFKAVRSAKNPERAAAMSLERHLQSGADVPVVEDFPLVPEEETPDLRDLAMSLQLRFVRAVEHWRGNTHLTLAAIIVRSVEESMRTPVRHRR